MSYSKSAANLIQIKCLINLLNTKPSSTYEIAESLGITRCTAGKWIRFLRANYPKNLVYISGWKRVGTRGLRTAIYSFGIGVHDVVKYEGLTSAQYNKLWRERKKRESRCIRKDSEGIVQHFGD